MALASKTRLPLAPALLWLLLPSSVLSASETAPRADQVRSAVTRSLPYIEREGQRWIEEKKCVTCHRVSFMTWATRAAGRHGLSIDREKLRQWEEWSVQKSLEKAEGQDEVDGLKNVDGLAQMILSTYTTSADEALTQSLAPLLPLILARQREDGSWAAAGQLPSQKRPAVETHQATTMWVALALGTINDQGARDARDRALQWLTDAKPGISTEWHAAKLLLEHQRGNEASAAEARRILLSFQKADGGWGWLVEDESDALATGLSLYALAVTDRRADAEAVDRAVQFLVSTQEPDGSWKVRGTKAAKKDRVEETASYWGTAWAVIGLVETLPASGR